MSSPGQDWIAMLQRQKQLTINAQGRKGQKPTNKPSRAFLERLFAKKVDLGKDGHWIRTCFISYAYPPSVTPVSELSPVLISDLVLETHHRGKVLLVRILGYPQRVQAVQNVVEDEKGNVERLGLYNTDPGLVPEFSLPKGAIIAVREPFYKATMDGGYTVRVDHPSDLIHLSPGDSLVPRELAPRFIELNVSATILKSDGNAAYLKKDYRTAVDNYSKALLVCSNEDQALRYDLYRNRANANLFLARFESALSDAEAAVIPSAETESLDDATLKLNAKAYYRAGRAAYSLRMLSRADAHFQQVESCTPDDVDAKRERKRTASSMEEEKAGCYDFIAMSDAASPTRNRLDHADYIVKVAVRSAGKRGRGLFATQDIPMGDLVLCEKGFGVVFGSESQTETYTMINLNTDRGSMGSHATLLYDLVHKLSYNPEQAKLYFDLYDGGYTPKIPPQVVDGVTVIDTFRTAAISEYNRFGCPNVRSSDTAGQRSDANAENDQEHSVGVWLVASHINHACDENASRAFIGDMMIIRAARDIKAGDEILMRYSNAEKDGTATRAHTMKTWGFECDCPVCEADAPTPKAQLERRKVLGSEAVSFLNNNRLSIQRPANAATIRKVEKLREDLEATYDKAAFKCRPRLALISLGQWLCQAYNFDSSSSQRKVIDFAKTLLGDLGYGVKVAQKKLVIDHTRCYAEATAIDAAMYIAHAHRYLGEEKLGLQYTEFAMRLWTTLYGEKKWFKGRYGSA